jgi:flagellar hook-basal body complex protein FliE
MSTPINSLSLIPSGGAIAPGSGNTPGSAGASAGFGDTLKDLLGKVDATSDAANDAVGKMIDGTGDVHEAMIALQKADVMLQMTEQIRNKLVTAYQDVMRMPV